VNYILRSHSQTGDKYKHTYIDRICNRPVNKRTAGAGTAMQRMSSNELTVEISAGMTGSHLA